MNNNIDKAVAALEEMQFVVCLDMADEDLRATFASRIKQQPTDFLRSAVLMTTSEIGTSLLGEHGVQWHPDFLGHFFVSFGSGPTFAGAEIAPKDLNTASKVQHVMKSLGAGATAGA